MYNVVTAVLGLGVLNTVVNFFRTLTGAGVNQFGLQIPGWSISLALIPALVAGILVFVLFQKKNAVAFWIYATMTILFSAGVLNMLAILPSMVSKMETVNPASQIVTTGNITLVAIFLVKLAICWMMWRLIENGVLKYPQKTTA